MGNFDFVRATLPSVYEDCARAESYLTTDPRSACIYARRSIEVLVKHLYDVLGLKVPYRDDLSARTDAPAFKAVTGLGITNKLTLIRKFGNNAVHGDKPVAPRVAGDVLRELHHVMIWAAFHHSPHPDVVPTKATFDPALAAKAAPLSQNEVAALLRKFQEQDEAHAAALKEQAEAKDAEIADLRAQIAAAQAAKGAVDDRDYSEAQTRDLFVDVLLREAGWALDDVRDREYEVTGMPPNGGKGYVDYVLWGADGLPLAVVEAKRTTASVELGRQQASLYADCLERECSRRPIIFYTNGYEHRVWDDAAGYPPRDVQGFFTRDELELMIQRRAARATLSTAVVDSNIVERPYQLEAIKAVDDVFDGRQREALLVMATGSGKTRTVIALVDQLMKAGWVKRALFLADRTALVTQATNAFRYHLPSATTINLVSEKATDGRVCVSTYPTMLGLINQVDDGLRRFGPGYFDLVVIDEAHRSVYQKYGAIFDWFDAMLVGLTATPKDQVDHNTYRLFHLEDGVPTYHYELERAVADGWLVPAHGVSIGSTFLRRGIRYADLSPDEKDQWDALDWGEDDPPDEVGAEEVNRFLFNEDTVDQVLARVMDQGYKVGGGDRLGKTIVFAKNQRHAEFVQERFEANWPHLGGHFAAVVTNRTKNAQHYIGQFSEENRPPHLAISVDMLDTGIDVPEVVNLVFFKTVHSTSKFWQMIGRGTRLRPNLFAPGEDKKDFLVFDFCGNFEYFGQELPAVEGSTQRSLTQRLFEARLDLVRGLDAASAQPELRRSTAGTLHEYVAGMSLDNVLVRPRRQWVERYAERAAWNSLTAEEADDVRRHLAGLPSAAAPDEEDAKRFDLVILRRQLAQIQGDAVTAERLREQVQAIAVALLDKRTIPMIAAQLELLDRVATDEWWVDVTLPMLETVRQRLRGLARLVDRTPRSPVYTDFADELGDAVHVALTGTTPGTNGERFRAKAAAYLRQHEGHVAMQRLRRNKQLTPDDLSALERMLLASGIGGQAEIDSAAAGSEGLGLFIRSLVGLDHEAAAEAFARYLDDTRFTVDQVRFVTMIVEELTENGVVAPGRLYEPPYTDEAPTGVDHVFSPTDVGVIVDILHQVREHARPVGAA